ncbi:DUF805 domain-containing protein [Maricaulis sp.]|uniref:DUF805 domain-containing protein n=1 Tax=Maricaulis sp. TaxID=1486257 RepID=UPI0025BBDEF9|nr:DUF805 domain-containing protein [Maricaulis sp.]
MSLSDFILKPADAKRILFGAAGKLSPQEFAQGIVAILAVNLVLRVFSMMPGLGMLFALLGLVVGLISLFAWVCVYSKRFHDAGKSGWLTLAAIVGVIVIAAAINLILAPLLGAGVATSGGSMLAVTPGNVLASAIGGLIANGVVGYFVYKL